MNNHCKEDYTDLEQQQSHIRFASISHDINLDYILPFIPQNYLEALVFRAVETDNIAVIYFLIGTTGVTVPEYLSSNKDPHLPFYYQSSITLALLNWKKDKAYPWDTHNFGKLL